MEIIEILLKIVMPVSIAAFIFLNKKQIRRMLSNFNSSSNSASYDSDPDRVADKLDVILRHYNE